MDGEIDPSDQNDDNKLDHGFLLAVTIADDLMAAPPNMG